MNSLTSNAARATLIGISLAIALISPAESKTPCTTSGDNLKPRFSHSSSHMLDRQSSEVTDKVCNHDSDGLVFRWEKALLSRGINNPLQPGPPCSRQRYPAKVDTVELDINAPIKYTQAGHIKRAGICAGTRDTKSKSNAPLISSLETSFIGDNANLIRLRVQTSFYLDRDQSTLRVNLRATHGNVVIGLGSMSGYEEVLLSDRRFIKLLEENSNPIGGFRPVSNLLQRREVDWLIPSLRQDVPLFFSNQNGNIDINFLIPISKSILASMKQRAAAVFVLDRKKNLLATGKFMLWVPN